MKLSKFPSKIFTYSKFDSQFYLMKTYKSRSYIVLSYGKLCYYAMYASQGKRYYSETIDGKRKKFSAKVLEKYLEQYNLLASYEKDKPKREFKDNVNEYYNKVINWQIKYFDLLNEKMK